MSDYPMWHKRFTEARNLLARASAEMEQACFEDNNNPKFEVIHKKLHTLLLSVDRQIMKNYKRVKKGK